MVLVLPIVGNSTPSISQSELHVYDTGLMSPLASALYDTWIEAIIIGVALHIYFRFTGGTAPMLWWVAPTRATKHKALSSMNSHAPDESKSNRQAHEAEPIECKVKEADIVSANVGPCMELEVQRLVANVARRANFKHAEASLAQYERLVRDLRVDLRLHLPDATRAQVLYAGLADCSIRIVFPEEGRLANIMESTVESSPTPAGRSGVSAKPGIVRLLKDMSVFGFPRSVELYSSMFRALTSVKLFEDALWLHDAMAADKLKPDRTMYVHLTSVATWAGQDGKALGFFRDLCKSGVPNMRTYMTVLRIFGRRNDYLGAAELLDTMRQHGAAPDALALNTVLSMCISAGALGVAERLLASWQHCGDTVSCNILLKGYAQQALWPAAERLLGKMLQGGPAPSIITFNTMMDCAVRSIHGQVGSKVRCRLSRGGVVSNRESDAAVIRDRVCASPVAARPWQLLDKLVALGLEPDRYTCSTLVKGIHLAGCTQWDLDRVVALLVQVGRERLHAQDQSSSEANGGSNSRLLEVLFNTLLDACVSIRDLDRMGRIFRLMEAFDVGLSAVTFGTLIKAFGQAGKLNCCHDVWRNMRAAGVAPTVVTYGCYIDACTRNSDADAAMMIFSEMARDGVKPNAVVYTSLIRTCAHARMPLKALELYGEMRDLGIKATAVTFNSVLDIVVRQLSDPEKLQEIMADMKRSSVKPDAVTYAILVKENCNAGNVVAAIALFRQLRDHSLVFDEIAFNTLLLACSNAGRVLEAEEIFGDMINIGVSPTNVTTSIMVKMYGKAKQLDKAIDVSQLVEATFGVKPNLYVYTCLIQACVRNKHVRKSWEVFVTMLLAGVMPDAITYGTTIQGCIYHNKFHEAMALLRHAYGVASPDGKTLPQAMGCEGMNDDAAGAVDLMNRSRPVSLQKDIVRVLVSTLQKKGFVHYAAEVDSITTNMASGTATIDGNRRKGMKGTSRRQMDVHCQITHSPRLLLSSSQSSSSSTSLSFGCFFAE